MENKYKHLSSEERDKIAFLLSVFAGWATKVSLFSVILATTFSIAIGMGFGLWPARQASKLDPIQALRYE